MEENDRRDLESLFAQVEDPRMERTKLHRLRDIIILAICGVLCGAEGWVEIEEFGNAKKAFFTDLLDLPNGIPSHDTFGRVFALIDPKQFEASFIRWVQGISQTVKGVIAIDGKTLRRSHGTRRLCQPLLGGEATGGERSRSIGNSRTLDPERSGNPGVSGPGAPVEGLARHWGRAGATAYGAEDHERNALLLAQFFVSQ